MTTEEKILAMLSELKSEVSGIKATQDEMRSDISEMQTTLTRVAVTQEGVVLSKLQLLYEGHGTILESLDSLTPKSRVELLEDEVAMMKDVIKLMRQEINELKKAQ